MTRKGTLAGYAWALGATAACTLAGLAMRSRFDLVNIAMVYLLAVVFVAMRYSLGPAILTSILCVGAFDFLFVPPRGTFTVDDVQYLLTFAIMVAVALVISRLVDSARRQARAQAALEIEAETARIRSALLASISHDLRTPLAIMAGAASGLVEQGDRLDATERRAMASRVFEQARELSDHVNKVLQMTRLETQALKIDADWVAPSDLVGPVLARLRERLAAHRVIADVPPDLPLIRVDAALIEQALGNLLENAARHTPAGTVVRLSVHAHGAEMTFGVQDFGEGVAEADLERVFDKFHRGTMEGSTAGMGLGLAICRAIVKLHGGRAWAERVSGGGLAFRFALPIEEAPSVPAEAAAE